LSFDLAKSLRNLKPHKVHGLNRRPDDQLDFADSTTALDGPPLLLDSCVYIDVLQGVAPRFLRDLLNARHCHHSSICLAEIVHPFGRLDPRRKDTQATLAAIRAVIERNIPSHRVAAPTADLWCDAGILAGLLFRTQGYGKERQQACLNDALIYVQAAKSGHAVLTRNLSDFDLLNQMAPRGRILLYRTVGAGTGRR
jgi:predicted nucleic acid-binding protein